MKIKAQKNILNYFKDTFLDENIFLKKIDLDKNLNNLNFRNNQNYIISDTNIEQLEKKVEYKSEYKLKNSSAKKIEYPYLTNFNWNRYERILRVWEYGNLNNIWIEKVGLNIIKLINFLFDLLKLLFLYIFIFLLRNKYWKIIFFLIIIGFVFLISNNIDYIMNRDKLWFVLAFKKYIIINIFNIIDSLIQFTYDIAGILLGIFFLYIYKKIDDFFLNKWIIWKYIFFSNNIETDNIITYM